ncbi:MAG: cysteine--1-D-myo-inosityl 2-amino-2-deoxy-alpha-D-glucopyranoside ligase [bacterium]
MQSWSAPAVPRLPGEGPALRLFDSATQQVRPTAPGAEARIYVCGITPYDATHMGHAATYVFFDMIQRYWIDSGHSVHYVQNVTDIDDPLLERAVATGEDWREIARRETELYGRDMEALRVLPPRDFIGAVESIPSVVACVDRLRERGAVYELEGDLYFDVTSDRLFGEVSHLDEGEMVRLFAERGGDPERSGKRHALDPLLWRAARPDEPAWDTSLGHGRPGWHIECVAIALDFLGMGFDVQGGGRDLVFPHHEMGASHAEVMTADWPFARHYVHVGMVGLDGEKMSKSRGNLVFVSRLREEGVDPRAIRLALLGQHYRSDWEWTPQLLAEAQDRLARWRDAIARGEAPDGAAANGAASDVSAGDGAAARAIDVIRERLSDDLDTPAALEAVDRWAEDVRRRGSTQRGARQMAEACDALLGVDLA